MINGAVNSDFEAIISLHVFDASGNQHVIEAMVDTGFNGDLTLPASLVAKLGLVWQLTSGGYLADASYVNFDVYSARILWDGVIRVVDVEETGTTALLGTGLLRNSRLFVQFKTGGSVEIDVLP